MEGVADKVELEGLKKRQGLAKKRWPVVKWWGLLADGQLGRCICNFEGK